MAQSALHGRQYRTALVGGRQHPARDRAGGPADQPAADGCRLRRARQRGDDRHSAPRHGNRGRGGPRAEGIRPRPPAPPEDRPWHALGDLGRAARRRAGSQRNLPPGLRQLPDPRPRQDGDGGTARPRRPILVRGPRPVSQSAYRDGGHHRGRWVRRRIGSPRREDDPRSLLPPPTRSRRRIRRRRRNPNRMMYATRTRNARPEPFAVEVSIGERLGLAHMDWPLAFAAVGLVAFSVLPLGQATRHDVPGSPDYSLERQAIYALLGVLGMFALTRI